MSAELISAIGLAVFALGLVACAASIGWRMLRLARAGIAQPRLIWRDVVVFGLFAGDFLLILVHRALGAPLSAAPAYALLTAAMAIAAVGVWLYYELAVIGHRRDSR